MGGSGGKLLSPILTRDNVNQTYTTSNILMCRVSVANEH